MILEGRMEVYQMGFDTKEFAFVVQWLKQLKGLGDSFTMGDMMWGIVLWSQETDGVELRIETPPNYFGAHDKRYEKLVTLRISYQTAGRALFGDPQGPTLHASVSDETKNPGEGLVSLVYKLYVALCKHESFTEEELGEVFGTPLKSVDYVPDPYDKTT